MGLLEENASLIETLAQMDLSKKSLTINEAFQRSVAVNGSKIVNIFPNGSEKSFDQLHSDVMAYASALRHLNLQPLSRIAIFSATCYEWVVAKYAINMAGFVVVAVNSGAHKDELKTVLDKTQSKAILIGDRYKYMDYYGTLCELFPELREGTLKPSRSLRHVISFSEGTLPGVVRVNDLRRTRNLPYSEHIVVSPDDPAVIIQSSGTTGEAKSIVLTHRNVVNAAELNFVEMRLQRTNVVLVNLPLYHSFGYVCIETNNTLNGLTSVFTSMAPKPNEILGTIERHNVTTIHGTPTTFYDILQCAEDDIKKCCSSLQNGTIGATTLHREVVQDIIKRLNLHTLMQGYGLTETSGACCYADGNNFKGYRLFPQTEVRIRGRTIHDASVKGEIQFRGPTCFREYLNDPEKTNVVVSSDGWISTGDIGFVNENGLLVVQDRLKDLIIKGGVNISPAEVERIILGVPGVADVHVVAVPDDRLGEEVCAWVKPSSKYTIDAKTIQAYCATKMSRIKCPKYVVVTNEFPKTSVGKVSKLSLRRAFEQNSDFHLIK